LVLSSCSSGSSVHTPCTMAGRLASDCARKQEGGQRASAPAHDTRFR
jgi:hypothetical protein